MRLLCGILLCSAIVHAGPIPSCGSQFQYSCASPTLGGFTVITPLASTGSTEITGYNSSNAVVFDQTIPIPPGGPAGHDVQLSVLNADAQLAIQSGQATTLAPCTSSSTTLCLISAPLQSTVTTGSETTTYVAMDTPVTQSVTEYSTTLIATLNGHQIFSQTFAVQLSDSSVQAAISLADSLLVGDGASFGAPSLASESDSLLGTQVSYVQTGEQQAGSSPSDAQAFGPAVVVACFPGNCVLSVVIYFLTCSWFYRQSWISTPTTTLNTRSIATSSPPIHS
jgi:hypothetical protein